ncbi:MAG: proprotein convertase P-domain-containing protein [Bacteroidia bacterium]|nr:proprotein convertase P-domain-containing protein [Bacteroidia bacterium]
MKNLSKLALLIAITSLVFACGDKKVLEPAASVKKEVPKKIGDSYQGGTIFYVDGSGQHGYIAAPNDIQSFGNILIPDNSQITSNIVVTGVPETSGLLLTSVRISISHTYNQDLDISLKAPNGTIIDLSSDNGGTGDNYTNTSFGYTGGPITSGSAPFTGSFTPEQSFSNFTGTTNNGTWSLIVADDASADVGTLISWSISFNPFGTFSCPTPNFGWYNGINLTTGASGSSAGTGSGNTSVIVTSQGIGTYAASYCNAYTNGGYSDWFLPSMYELDYLYQNRSFIGNLNLSAIYWSSTEFNSNTAWATNFSNGLMSNYTKSSSYLVRPIRSF